MKIEQSIRVRHAELSEKYSILQKVVDEFLKESCISNRWLFSQRLKLEESFALKLATGREVDDFYGCTITVPTISHIDEAATLVTACFDEINRRPSVEIYTKPTEFSFDSLRIYCRLKPGVEAAITDGLKFEVQVKTLLEDAWSRATHDFSYKGADISWGRERLASQLKAVLDNVELSISEMASLSQSQNLKKVNPKYIKKQKLLSYLQTEIANSSSLLMPEDIRRLVDIVDDVLTVSAADVDDLRRWMLLEDAEGRGRHTTNLSIYSVIIQTMINHNLDKFKEGLNKKNQRVKVFIPAEIVLPSGVDISDLGTAFAL